MILCRVWLKLMRLQTHVFLLRHSHPRDERQRNKEYFVDLCLIAEIFNPAHGRQFEVQFITNQVNYRIQHLRTIIVYLLLEISARSFTGWRTSCPSSGSISLTSRLSTSACPGRMTRCSPSTRPPSWTSAATWSWARSAGSGTGRWRHDTRSNTRDTRNSSVIRRPGLGRDLATKIRYLLIRKMNQNLSSGHHVHYSARDRAEMNPELPSFVSSKYKWVMWCYLQASDWSMAAVRASDWQIVQVIMSCWDIKRSSGSNHVLYLISILNCQQAVMNVCLNEVLRSYCIAVARLKKGKKCFIHWMEREN